jgi:hypothetical protein
MDVFDMYEEELRNFVLKMKEKNISAYNEKVEWENYEKIMFLKRKYLKYYIPFLLTNLLFFVFLIAVFVHFYNKSPM